MTFVPSAIHQKASKRRPSYCVALSFALWACGGKLNAGTDAPQGVLPVDERNPVVICNDGWSDNWQGEYAMLFASTGNLTLAGIIINEAWPWEHLDENMAGWRSMVTAARNSGLKNIPDPIASTGKVLTRPKDENIDSTVPNRSEGAKLILDAAAQFALPFRPLVVITGGRPTDVADAYLMDHTLPERVVVVSALGWPNDNGASMGIPNGQLDKWADIIVTNKFRYIQTSVYYGAAADVPSSLTAQLPINEFTTWVENKQSGLENAYDQVAVQVVTMPSVVLKQTRVSQQGKDSDDNPLLVNDPNGHNWLVTQTNVDLATARFGQMLLDPATFDPAVTSPRDAGP